MGSLLLVEDHAPLRTAIAAYLRRFGAEVWEAGTCGDARREWAARAPDLMIIDYELPDGTALDLLQSLREQGGGESVIVLTGMGTIDLAVKAIKAGADHFLTKPVDLESLSVLVQRILETSRVRRRGAVSKLNRKLAPNPFLGHSRAITELCEVAHAVLSSEAPVLIQGETGTGKGVLARWLHDHGKRKEEPFVDLNCAGLSHELVSSELFGHMRGAFTGAVANKVGLLEAANRGSLFLDEIGELDPLVQPKLLKVLEERTFRRVGDVTARACDVRLISATHRSLSALARADRFREDLRFRINTLTLDLPSLRERPEDIPDIARALLDGLGAHTTEITDDALELMRRYPWPGNIREMRNVLERAILFRKGNALDRGALRFDRNLEPDPPPEAELCTLDEAERLHIATTLTRLGGRVDDAARVLAVSRSTLYAKLKRYGITVTHAGGVRSQRSGVQ
jgi:DNA-binding NtrC family response regulator